MGVYSPTTPTGGAVMSTTDPSGSRWKASRVRSSRPVSSSKASCVMRTGTSMPCKAFSPDTMDMSARVALLIVKWRRTDSESLGMVVVPWRSSSESCTSENTRFQS